MSIFLKAVQRINPSEPDEPKKWYPVQYTTKRVDESEVAMLIAGKGERLERRHHSGCHRDKIRYPSVIHDPLERHTGIYLRTCRHDIL